MVEDRSYSTNSQAQFLPLTALFFNLQYSVHQLILKQQQAWIEQEVINLLNKHHARAAPSNPARSTLRPTDRRELE